jgi:hypothetical protein
VNVSLGIKCCFLFFPLSLLSQSYLSHDYSTSSKKTHSRATGGEASERQRFKGPGNQPQEARFLGRRRAVLCHQLATMNLCSPSPWMRAIWVTATRPTQPVRTKQTGRWWRDLRSLGGRERCVDGGTAYIDASDLGDGGACAGAI